MVELCDRYIVLALGLWCARQVVGMNAIASRQIIGRMFPLWFLEGILVGADWSALSPGALKWS